MIRIAIPDLISPSYFPLIAAVELGILGEKGFEASVELVFPISSAYEALKSGSFDYVGGAAHSATSVFEDWRGCRLLAALSQGMYWFLVARADLNLARGDVAALQGLRIGAAPGPVDGLRAMLDESGLDPTTDVLIAPVRGTTEPGTSFGVTAAKALEEGEIDAFWANGMAAEIAIQRGVGKVIVDARRGDGPPGASAYTFPALVVTDTHIMQDPGEVASVVAALEEAQTRLKNDPTLATQAAIRAGFPGYEAGFIATLIEMDAPFYDPSISPATFDALKNFAYGLGLCSREPRYEDVVAIDNQQPA